MTKLLNKKISVCLSSDDNYALWMGCSIYSILKNTGTNDVLNFYIFEDGISAEHKRELESLVKTRFTRYILFLFRLKNYLLYILTMPTYLVRLLPAC